MISAGRVLIMPKGEYDASTPYSMLDLVSYNGSSYVAKRSTTGNLPTNATYWQLSALGGNTANMAANFAQIEATEYASRAYSQGDYLVNKDGQFCKVLIAIAIGDELNSTNTEVTSVEDVIADLTAYVDGLDAEDAKITGKTAIAGQTDLHTLGVGNYYKTNTSVYVTNAPTGIDSVPTAKFRLTVENTNNAVSDSTKILTLRTFDGKTYTQAYDGTTWSDWKLLGDNADVPTYTGATSAAPGVKGLVPAAAAGDNDKFFKGDGTFEALGTAAHKDSTDAITEDSTDLIESGAVYPLRTSLQTLSSQSSKITNAVRYMQIFTGAKNLLKNKLASSVTSGLTITVHSNGAISVSGRAEANVVLKINDYSTPITGCVLSGCPNGGGSQTYELRFVDGGGTEYYDYGNSVTIPASTTGAVWLVVRSGQTMNHVFYPMICLATELAPTEFTEFALSNQLLTKMLSKEDLYTFEAGRVESANADYIDFIKKNGSYNRIVIFEGNNALTLQHYNSSGTLVSEFSSYGTTGTVSGVIGGTNVSMAYSKSANVVTYSNFIDITTDWTGWSPIVITGFPKPLTDAYSFSYVLIGGVLHEVIADIHLNGGLSIYSSAPVGTALRIRFSFSYITND